ncbi:protein DEHYDRATION-INDUCED 19 homolog 5 isoform X1 [Amborella trichopoda]|uniref:protein DEHYDRATION-INDUCED 19 homolog 5 isoform X1 n=1 Tax=Amborella trichopoda TaxID=13333 RepID=UPI0005D3CD72|nr:protein DEHYDRATION-INDUCED 19 homolog 5 isoform X1 [Amborella trichopoda]|eukprot:XP_011626204.1 protein DEHYDRATION-INDUCED 19 homolog 5 isoform X1 [Amborella trichopoda]
MDVEFWASRMQAAKHLSAVHASRLNSGTHLVLDDSEVDEDMQACFPCPFCYVEVEVCVLCSHLQEEHCFDIKNTVCPVCAASVGRDMIGHFTFQHTHLLKRRRKSQKGGLWTYHTSIAGKEFRELSSFLGMGSTIPYIPNSAPDPLLSPFLSNSSLPYTNESNTNSPSDGKITSNSKDTERYCACRISDKSSDGAGEQAYRERVQRAEYIQQLLLSTIL